MSDDHDISFSVAMCRVGFNKDKCTIREQHIGYGGSRQIEKGHAERNNWSSYLCDECGYLYDAETSPERLKEHVSKEPTRTMPHRTLS